MFSKERLVLPSSDYYLFQPSATAARLYFSPIAVGYFYYQAGYHLKRNTYHSFLVMYLKKGNCHVWIQGQERTALEGQIVLIDCYASNEYAFPDGAEVPWLHFCGPLSRAYYEAITEKHGNILSQAGSYPIDHGIDQILASFRNSRPVKEAEISEIITHMLNSLLNLRTYTGNQLSRAKVVENSLTYINEHFSEPLTLEFLAEQSNMSPFHYTRVFTAETGYTPHQYLLATRLNSAKYQLSEMDASVKEIAFNSGFNSESSFCSTFRKWENMTPSEYREMIHRVS